MRDVTNANFGLAIAYLLPGFVALFGISFFSETVKGWLTVASLDAPTVGGFLYVTLGSLAAGLTVSTIRWAVIDTVHHKTGIREPNWDFSEFAKRLSTYHLLIEIHYRYYQWYANCLVAVAFTLVAALTMGAVTSPLVILSVVVLEWVLWLGSRDTLGKYYERAEQLLGKNPNVTEMPIGRIEADDSVADRA